MCLSHMLVRIRNVAPAQPQAGQRRIGQSDRIVRQAAKNKPVELLGRGADGRNRLAVSVGQSSRMIWLMTTAGAPDGGRPSEQSRFVINPIQTRTADRSEAQRSR